MVALKLKDDKELTSSDSYQNSELVTYAEARKSTNPKPYIPAVVASSGVDGNMFILGGSRNTSDPTSRRRRSTSSDYYNGPLERTWDKGLYSMTRYGTVLVDYHHSLSRYDGRN